ACLGTAAVACGRRRCNRSELRDRHECPPPTGAWFSRWYGAPPRSIPPPRAPRTRCGVLYRLCRSASLGPGIMPASARYLLIDRRVKRLSPVSRSRVRAVERVDEPARARVAGQIELHSRRHVREGEIARRIDESERAAGARVSDGTRSG